MAESEDYWGTGSVESGWNVSSEGWGTIRDVDEWTPKQDSDGWGAKEDDAWGVKWDDGWGTKQNTSGWDVNQDFSIWTTGRAEETEKYDDDWSVDSTVQKKQIYTDKWSTGNREMENGDDDWSDTSTLPPQW